MTPHRAATRWAAAKTERGRSFGAVAADYAAWRPGYPPELVAFLAGGAAGHAQRRRILDLGAGTGQLSEALHDAGHDVVAADVSADMLAHLATRLPGVPTLVAGAEDLPFPDGDVDVVLAAQAPCSTCWTRSAPDARTTGPRPSRTPQSWFSRLTSVAAM